MSNHREVLPTLSKNKDITDQKKIIMKKKLNFQQKLVNSSHTHKMRVLCLPQSNVPNELFYKF